MDVVLLKTAGSSLEITFLKSGKTLVLPLVNNQERAFSASAWASTDLGKVLIGDKKDLVPLLHGRFGAVAKARLMGDL